MPEQAKKLNDEVQYLKRIGALLVLNSAPEALFKKVTKLASEVCKMPVACISLIDHRQQWFKTSVGLEEGTTIDRDIAFFSHAILQSTAVVEIPDAQLDSRFSSNPLITQAPKLRAYAGVPIMMPSGKKVGILCVINPRAGVLSPLQKTMLKELAQVVAQALVNSQQMDSQPVTLNLSTKASTPRSIDHLMDDQNKLSAALAA